MRGASIAVIHCGLIENERTPKKEKKKSLLVFHYHQLVPPVRLQLMSFVSPLDAQGA